MNIPFREILNAIFYLLRSGCHWRLLPHDYPKWKTTETSGVRGYDAGKKVNGRKRHVLVDVMGLLLMVVVHAANIQDRDGAWVAWLNWPSKMYRL